MGVKAILMAGGKGTRLRPITYSIPKPLVPIAGRPCIGYSLDAYRRAGINDVIITTGYKFESLITGVLEYKDLQQNILFSVEKEPAGTAGGIKLVSRFIDDTFIVGSGDILADFDIKEILEFHRKKKAKITIVLSEVEDPSQMGIVELRDGKITKFLEKPSRDEIFSNQVNAGIYIIEPEILDEIPEGIQFDFSKDLFPKLMRKGVEIFGYKGNGTWLDTGRPRDMIKANQIMVEKYGKNIDLPNMKGTFIIKNVDEMKGIKLEGPTFISEKVKIGEGSTIKGSAIYSNVEIGNNVEIEDSIIMDCSKVRSGSKVIKSVLMRNTSIGSDCIVQESVISPDLSLQNGSRVYNVALSSDQTVNDS